MLPNQIIDNAKRERLRRLYQPEKVRMLLVGESPPASGRFFYQRDSGLYRAVRDAFQLVDASVTDDNFLLKFQASGCYLVDLCLDPVDQYTRAERREACRRGESALSSTVRELCPAVLVTLLKSIQPNVRRSVLAAEWKGSSIEVPYPGRWKHHRNAFLEAFVPLLSDFMRLQ